jgi:hypothetical protein
MKIQITIDTELDNEDLNRRSPLMKILKVIAGDKDSQVTWYEANRDRILLQEKEKRAAYAREQYEKRKVKKAEEHKNIVVMPEPPADNILRFN